MDSCFYPMTSTQTGGRKGIANCAISNQVAAGCVSHEAAGQVTDSASTAELEIVWIYHGHGFLLLSHDLTQIFVRNQSIFAAENATNKSRSSSCVQLGGTTHVERMHRSVRRQGRTVPGKTRTYWSIWVMSEYIMSFQRSICPICDK